MEITVWTSTSQQAADTCNCGSNASGDQGSKCKGVDDAGMSASVVPPLAD